MLKSYHGHSRRWWRFAYECVLEETVRRRRRNWQWTHIRAHRRTVAEYIDLYKTKLTSKKADARVEKQLDDCQQLLDVFNITLARQQAELQVLVFI